MKQRGGILILFILLGSCIEKTVPLTPAQIKAKADTIYAARAAELKKQYEDDLEQRMTIELKPRTDSIIKARETAISPAPVTASTPAPSTSGEIKMPETRQVPIADTFKKKLNAEP